MLRSMSNLEDYAIHATDGNIGHVKDFYFDDVAWVIRYFVVETGNWLLSRKVLISPMSFGKPNWRDRVLPVSITKEQVKNSPDIDTEKPVSRQHEIQHLGYYGFPYYWGGPSLWGDQAYPGMMANVGGFITTPNIPQSKAGKIKEQRVEAARHRGDDPELRSCKAVIGYEVEATDGNIGHVKSMLVDDETWAIRYLIVETGNWWLGHEVLIAPQWIEEVRWPDTTVSVNLTRQAVRDAPPYDRTVEMGREQEVKIHTHYQRPGYWTYELDRVEVLPPED
jgi:hypothetical protein